MGDSAAFAVSVATGSGPFYSFERHEQNAFPLENVFPPQDEINPYREAYPYRTAPCVFYDVSYETPTSGLYEVGLCTLNQVDP